MKKLLSRYVSFLLFVGMCFLFFSCKKDRVCICGGKADGVATSFYDTTSKAKKSCKALEEEFKTGCELE